LQLFLLFHCFYLVPLFLFHRLEFPSFSYKLHFIFHNVTYLNYFGSIKRKCAKYAPEIQSKVFIGGTAFRNKKNFHQ
jgi:hypothetical protein